MTAVLYPIAPNAEAALAAPRGRAARERDAEWLATWGTPQEKPAPKSWLK